MASAFTIVWIIILSIIGISLITGAIAAYRWVQSRREGEDGAFGSGAQDEPESPRGERVESPQEPLSLKYDDFDSDDKL